MSLDLLSLRKFMRILSTILGDCSIDNLLAYSNNEVRFIKHRQSIVHQILQTLFLFKVDTFLGSFFGSRRYSHQFPKGVTIVGN